MDNRKSGEVEGKCEDEKWVSARLLWSELPPEKEVLKNEKMCAGREKERTGRKGTSRRKKRQQMRNRNRNKNQSKNRNRNQNRNQIKKKRKKKARKNPKYQRREILPLYSDWE